MENPINLSIFQETSQNRIVYSQDAFRWLDEFQNHSFPPNVGIFTSLPDISELPKLFGSGPSAKFEKYESWFTNSVTTLLSKLSPGCYGIFLQSDVRALDRAGNVIKWIDKSFLCTEGARRAGCELIWHKIALLKEPGVQASDRPKYSHLLCYRHPPSSPQPHYLSSSFSTPDVFLRGPMVWVKGLGLLSAAMGVGFLRDIAQATCIVDPFCGEGTVLAVASAAGLRGVGVELSSRRANNARLLDLLPALSQLSPGTRKTHGLPGPLHPYLPSHLPPPSHSACLKPKEKEESEGEEEEEEEVEEEEDQEEREGEEEGEKQEGEKEGGEKGGVEC